MFRVLAMMEFVGLHSSGASSKKILHETHLYFYITNDSLSSLVKLFTFQFYLDLMHGRQRNMQ